SPDPSPACSFFFLVFHSPINQKRITRLLSHMCLISSSRSLPAMEPRCRESWRLSPGWAFMRSIILPEPPSMVTLTYLYIYIFSNFLFFRILFLYYVVS